MSFLSLLPATLIASFALTGVAHANKLKLLNYKLDDSVGAIELLAKDPLGEPWMRFERGGIRIWFPDIDDITRFEKTDDKAIHSVRLRYGSDNTAVLKIDFSDHRMLRKDDIELVRNGAYCLIKIHHAPRAAPPTATLPAPAPTLQPAVQATAAEAAQPPYKDGMKRLAAFSAGMRGKPNAAASTTAEKPSAVHTTQQKVFGFAPGQRGVAGMGALLLISLGLGAIYGFIHYSRRNQQFGQVAPIQVIAVKRMGHRHQLMLIRALGQDHLLSINGGRVERLASAPTPPEQLQARGAAKDEITLPGRNTRMGLGLFAPFSLQKKLRSALEDDSPPSNNANASAEPFNDELMGFMRTQMAQRRSSVGKTPLPPGPISTAAGSDAVAGIARLRNRALS